MRVKFGTKMNHKQIYKLYTNNFLYDKNYRHGDGAKLEGSVQQLSDNGKFLKLLRIILVYVSTILTVKYENRKYNNIAKTK
jgi:hypothetical protein